MSDEQQLDNSDFGHPGIEKSMGFEPMPEATPAAETGSDALDTDSSAYRHLSRQEIPEPEELFYQDKTGEKLPDNLTIERERGADDISALRRAKQAEYERQLNDETTAAVDALRQQVQDPTGQPQQQPQSQQPVQDAEYPEIQPEQTEAAIGEGVDPEIVDVLNRHPKLREAVTALDYQAKAQVEAVKQQAVTEVQQAKTAYQHGLAQNAATALAVLTVDFPEFAGLSGPQLDGALRVSNPQRVDAFRQRVNQVNAVIGTYQQHIGQQQQQFREQQIQQQARNWQALQQYKEVEERKFEAATANEKETVKAIGDNLFDLTQRHYGISRSDWQALASNPDTARIIYSSNFQSILFDGLKAREAKQSLAAHRNNPVPQVARPGVSEAGARSDDGEVSALWSKLNKNNQGLPGLRAAAELVAARRRARG